MQEALAIMERLLADGRIQRPQVAQLPAEEEKWSVCFCKFHQAISHNIMDCYKPRKYLKEFMQLNDPSKMLIGGVNDQPFLPYPPVGSINMISGIIFNMASPAVLGGEVPQQ
uniref:Uncharacterized protein n=1 Tax=Nelumbo nucifera TaxID=4432 RepID=A0A822YXH5_NELNU|nr:TPA_asm: hypothetical protein HUJ06_007888 [Nelumbo nucifera]